MKVKNPSSIYFENDITIWQEKDPLLCHCYAVPTVHYATFFLLPIPPMWTNLSPFQIRAVIGQANREKILLKLDT